MDSLAGYWGEGHVSGHINVLEMRAVLLAIRANHGKLAGRSVHLWTDNFCVMVTVNKMRSPSPSVMIEYRQLFQLLQQNGMTLKASWIDTVSNHVADGLSRAEDPHEYLWSPQLPQLAMDRWQVTLTHDCFAADWAYQPGMTYDSKWGSAEALNVNTMLRPWQRTTEHWWTPPANFIAETLTKIEQDGAAGVLLTPDWASSVWWRRAQHLSTDSVRVSNPQQYVQRIENNKATPEPCRERRWAYRMWRIGGSRN